MRKTETVNRKTYAGLDIAKFLCALLILFYHYFSEHGTLPGILGEALSLYAIAVALFMAISGFLTFSKLESVSGYQNRWKIVKKQALRILRIYALWSIPYLIYTVFSWDWQTITLKFVLWQVRGWIFNSTFYTIWFMPSLALGLVFTFLVTEKLPEYAVNLLAAMLYIIGSLTMTYSYFGDMIPGFSIVKMIITDWLGGSRGWLVYAFPLIMVGRRMARHKEKVSTLKTAALSFVFVFLILIEALLLRKAAGHTGIDMTLMMIPSVYCILGFLISLKIPSGAYCLWMRKMSILIIMSQRLFLTVLPNLFSEFFNKYIFANYYAGAVIISVFVIGFSTLIILFSKKISVLKKLYS